MSKSLLIVEIFVSQRQADDALSEHRPLRMLDQIRVAGVGDGLVDRIDQPDVTIRFTHQQRPGVTSEPAASKIGLDLTATRLENNIGSWLQSVIVAASVGVGWFCDNFHPYQN